MKFLILSLVILGLAGTRGHHIPQHKEAQPSVPPVDESFRSVLRQLFIYRVEFYSSDLSHKDDQLLIGKRLVNLMKSVRNLGIGVFRFVQETYDEVDKEISEKYPVYRKSVIPVVAEFCSNLTKTLMDLKDEIKPHYDHMNAEIVKQEVYLFNQFRSIVLKDEKNWMLYSSVSDLVDGLKPYREQVRHELEEAKKDEVIDLTESEENIAKYLAGYLESLKKLVYGEDELDKFIEDISNPFFV